MNAKFFTNEQELEIVKQYQKRILSVIEIANMFDCKSRDPIYKVLKKYNIKKRVHPRNTFHNTKDDTISEIMSLYKTGHSAKEIGVKYNIGTGVVLNILENKGVKRRKNNRIYNFNENYFDDINTQNKAYILGFIYADGCVSKTGREISMTIHEKDVEIIKYILKEIDLESPIGKVKGKNHVRISINSVEMCQTLIRMGCENGKTTNLSPPIISPELTSHFIRGFMDGDGCISLKSKGERLFCSLSFTGTKNMLDFIKEKLKIKNEITYYKGAYSLNCGKREDVLYALNYIYNDAELYLNRKYLKYKEYLEFCTNNPKLKNL